MIKVTSKDGTSIAVDQVGAGPALIITGGFPTERAANAPLAAILAAKFTVFTYDRRGRGESGDTAPYSKQREIEDIEAVINAAGGSAFMYGTSGGAVFALNAVASGLNITKLALWEPPFVVDDSRTPVPADYKDQLSQMLAENRRGDMVEHFFTQAVNMPAQFVAPMRQMPFWGAMEEVAHTLIYDATFMGDFSLPRELLASVTAPTIVIDGATIPWMHNSAEAVAAALPDAERKTLAGQPHNVAAEAIAPVIVEFFSR